ncbi:MAG: hypothetical protein Q8K02_03875 [Flavobacterium sp.]|nr:hypothetical protein [Flavobacterium sp.]
MKNLFYFTILLFSVSSYSQKIIYKGNGNIYDSNDKRISPNEVRNMISYNPALVNLYNEGREKKTIGNVLLIGGAALIVSDLAVGATADVTYPTALTYIGLGSMLLSIPIKSGFSKKIDKVVEVHNKSVVYRKSSFEINDLTLITNRNGIGFQITF